MDGVTKKTRRTFRHSERNLRQCKTTTLIDKTSFLTTFRVFYWRTCSYVGLHGAMKTTRVLLTRFNSNTRRVLEIRQQPE